MSTIVNQSHVSLQTHFAYQFKKIVISRFLTENCFVLLLQYMGLVISTFIPSSLLWFASGTACAFIFLRGYSILPGILLGSFFAYYLATHFVLVSLLCAFLLTIQAFLLLWISYRFMMPTIVFYHKNKLIHFILISAVLTGVISFLLAYISHQTTLTYHFWIANLNGILFFAPAIVTLDNFFPEMYRFKQMKKCLLYLLFGALILAVLLLSITVTPFFTIVYSSFIACCLLIISLRFNWCGIMAALFSVGLWLNLASYLQAPLFTTQFSMLTIMYLSSLLGITSIMVLFLAI